jgi:hypothetical protein
MSRWRDEHVENFYQMEFEMAVSTYLFDKYSRQIDIGRVIHQGRVDAPKEQEEIRIFKETKDQHNKKIKR